MTLINSRPDNELYERANMFQVAIMAASRHKFGLAFHTMHRDSLSNQPTGWVGEQYREAWGAWTRDPLSFPTFYYNIGIPPDEVWPVLDENPVSWQVAVGSKKGLGRLEKLYVGGNIIA